MTIQISRQSIRGSADVALKDELRATLLADPCAVGEDIRFVVSDGTVIMDGTVSDRETAEDLMTRLAQVHHCRRIVNRLRVAV